MAAEAAAPKELDKKAAKKAEKQRKKEEKKRKRLEAAEGLEEEKPGSKIAIVLVTFLIILVWIAILALLIKLDFGGFGSTVLKPILKNVPVVNQILPSTPDDGQNSDYPYATLEEAINRIKELELEAQQKQTDSQAGNQAIADLQAEVARLKVFEENQKTFEEQRSKYYNEVVFGEKAPDVKEYIQYYAGIDKAHADALYKQAVVQEAADTKVEEYAKTYASMKPKAAAALLEAMPDNLDLVAKILQNMDTQKRADILGAMTADFAAKVTKLLAP